MNSRLRPVLDSRRSARFPRGAAPSVPRARSPSAKHGTRNPKLSPEKGVALVMTLAILAIMLVLVVSFATLSRTEVGSSNNYRDYVASKYLAQGGLNRAMAEIAYTYSASSNSFNTGLGSIYSSVDTNGVTYAALQLAGGAPAWYATDIERVVTNSRTGQVYAKRGADGVVDAVVLPNQLTNSTYSAQWIGMKDTNGVLVGRVAYIITAGGLNINAIGNVLSSGLSGGMTENARNEGQSVAELNLPAALMAMNPNTGTGWSFANATNDLYQIILGAPGLPNATKSRYGADGWPGNALGPSADDNENAAAFGSDGIDNNGDGVVDESGEGTNEPLEFLTASEGRDNPLISRMGDDQVITDLKMLHDGSIGNDAASQARFRNNFALVRRWFTTQSPIPVSPTLIPLNGLQRQSFFDALTNKFATINFPTNNAVVQAKVAANIVSYAWPAADDSTTPTAPFVASANSSNVLGVGRVPFINQVELAIAALAERTIVGAATNIRVTLNCIPKVELWCPYTNGFNVATTAYLTNSGTIPGWGNSGGAFSWVARSDSGPVAAFGTWCSFDAITNPAQFKVVAMAPFQLGGQRTWNNVFTTPINQDILVSNISFSARCESAAGLLDSTALFKTNYALVFPTNLLMQATNGPSFTYSFTNVISFALNDPRVKEWFVEYAGLVTNSAVRTSLGGLNLAANLTSGTCQPTIDNANPIFRPDLGEDSDFTGPVGQGIGPSTFYVKHLRRFSSIAELGRIHRGTPWRTIDFKGGGTDGNLLDYFTTVSNMWGGSTLFYTHGRVNINARSDATPIWAALFAGMPYRATKDDGTKTAPVFFDYSSGVIDANFPESKEFGKIFGSRAGSLTHLGALTSVADLSNLSSNHGSVFQPGLPPNNFAPLRTDEDKEYLLGRMINLVGTQGQGNTFTIYAWGQSLRGAPSASYNTNRFVTAETLIVAMVRPEVDADGKLMLKLIYYRYNPDLELSQGF